MVVAVDQIPHPHGGLDLQGDDTSISDFPSAVAAAAAATAEHLIDPADEEDAARCPIGTASRNNIAGNLSAWSGMSESSLQNVRPRTQSGGSGSGSHPLTTAKTKSNSPLPQAVTSSEAALLPSIAAKARPGHGRKRTWSAPVVVMSESNENTDPFLLPGTFSPVEAEASATGTSTPAGSTEASAKRRYATPERFLNKPAVINDLQLAGFYGSHANEDAAESYDDFDEHEKLNASNTDMRASPTTPLDEADRGGEYWPRRSSASSYGSHSKRSYLPDITSIDVLDGLGEKVLMSSVTTSATQAPSPSLSSKVRAISTSGGEKGPSIPHFLGKLGGGKLSGLSRGRHMSLDLNSPGEGRESEFVNDDGGVASSLALPPLQQGVSGLSGTTSSDRNDELRSNSSRPPSSRDIRGRIIRSVSAHSLINLGRLGGVETINNQSDVTAPLNVDLRQIASEAVDAENDMIADVAQSAAARQAADGNGSIVEPESLIKELVHYFRYRPLKKKLLMLTVIGSVIWVCIDFATTGYIRQFLSIFMSWLQEHPAGGFFIFILLFILTTLVFIPPSILTLGSGVAFAKAFGLGPGIVLASSASFVGACVGAVIAFFRARYLMRDLIKLFANRYPIVKATDRAIKHKGFRIYLLLRMCPVIPFNALNYIGGITGVKWTAYTCALIGILPWQIVLVFIGATVGSVNDMREEDQNSYNKVSIIIGCVFSSLSVIIMWYYARKELRKEIAAHEEDIANEEAASRGEDVEAQDVSDRFSLAPSASDTADDEFTEDGEDEAWYWLWV